MQETFKKIDSKKIPIIPAKAWTDAETGRALLKKYSKSLAFLDKISKMDYVLPENFRFTFLYINNYSYLRFLVRLRALSIGLDRKNVSQAVQTLSFLKKFAEQPDSIIHQLLAAACQKYLLDELRKINPDEKTSGHIKKVLINRSDIKNAVRAELYVAVSIMESMKKSEPEIIGKYDSAQVVKKLSVYAGFSIDFLQGKITEEEFLKKTEFISKHVTPDEIQNIHKSEEAYKSAILKTYSGVLTPKIIEKLPKWP
jgi:hypothetical protein